MKAVHFTLFLHLLALMTGLAGLLIFYPHPELWNGDPTGREVYNFGMLYAGSLHMVFGALTMLFFGLFYVGRRKTLIFFVASCLISLSMELLGTGTGFPFGAYSYTGFLGYKIAGHVPYSIPLSWFYMGFSSFLLANVITTKLGLRRHLLWSLVLGVYFLTVWDLSLDPAMASDQLPIHFWIWHVSGPYYGMPIRNLVGWTATGLIFMLVSRLLWRSDFVPSDKFPVWVPLTIYIANTIFAVALNLGASLWVPAVVAVILGILPALLALKKVKDHTTPSETQQKSTPGDEAARFTMRNVSRTLTRNVTMHIEGREHIPASGPVLIVAHHVHHLYDGCVFLQTLKRWPHILVALDWSKTRRQRRFMEWACSFAQWPVILRQERLQAGVQSAYDSGEVRPYLRRAVKKVVHLLRGGEVLVIFPEAYPNIDPEPSPKQDLNSFLSFRSGFIRLIEQVEKDGKTQVAIVPAGFRYTQQDNQWQVTLHYGPALFRKNFASGAQCLKTVEEHVRTLSASATALLSFNQSSSHSKEAFQL